jgi:tripartite ATP-independent transporter DctP family solute receptor
MKVGILALVLASGPTWATVAQGQSTADPSKSTKRLKMASLVTADSALGAAMENIGNDAQKAGFEVSKDYSISTIPGTKGKGELAMMQAVSKGLYDLIFLTDGPCANIAPACAMFSIPYLFNDQEHATKVADNSAIIDHISKDFSKENMKLLAIYENGWRHVFSPVETVKSPDQLKDKKFRTMQSPIYLSFVNALGAKPNPTAWNDVYEVTKAKVVYAIEAPMTAFYESKLHETNKYVTLNHHVYSVFYAIVNKDYFEKLSKADQEVLQKTIWDNRVEQRRRNQEKEKIVMNSLEKTKGVVIYKPSPQEMEKFRQAGAKVREENAAILPSKIAEIISAK